MSGFPSTYNWQDTWSLQAFATNSEIAYTVNEQDFVIEAAGGAYNAYGLMSVKKQVKEGNTKFWWGYSTQVNMGSNLN